MIRTYLQRRIIRTAGAALAVLAVSVVASVKAEVYYTGTAQFATGNYIFSQRTNSFSIYNGLGVNSGALNFSLSVPLVYQSTPWLSLSGTHFIPSGGTQHTMVRHRMGMPGQTVLIDTTKYHHIGLGDPFLHAEARLLQERSVVPSISLTGDVKPPLANPSNGFGTGEWDWAAGVSLAKKLGPVFGFASLSYWVLGDMSGLELKDPLAYSLSLGRPLAGDKYAVMASISGESRVIANTEASTIFSLMGSRNLTPQTSLSLSLGFGLTNSAPDFSLGLGWRTGL